MYFALSGLGASRKLLDESRKKLILVSPKLLI
jgi:hypothetical protein